MHHTGTFSFINSTRICASFSMTVKSTNFITFIAQKNFCYQMHESSETLFRCRFLEPSTMACTILPVAWKTQALKCRYHKCYVYTVFLWLIHSHGHQNCEAVPLAFRRHYLTTDFFIFFWAIELDSLWTRVTLRETHCQSSINISLLLSFRGQKFR